MNEDIIKTINDSKLIKVNDYIYLTQKQKYILDKYQIFYDVKDIKELLFLIDEQLNMNYNLELDEIAMQLAEFDYYHNSNK